VIARSIGDATLKLTWQPLICGIAINVTQRFDVGIENTELFAGSKRHGWQ